MLLWPVVLVLVVATSGDSRMQNENEYRRRNLKRLTTFSILQKVDGILAWTRLFRRLLFLDFKEILDLENF